VEQKPVLSLFFYLALIGIGLLLIRQGAAPFYRSLAESGRESVPARLDALGVEKIPNPPHGCRLRLNACRYRYEFNGKSYIGQRFSLFDDEQYSQELPDLVRRITRKPQVLVNPESPMDAVLSVDPPLNSLFSLLIGLLFLHGGTYFGLLWLYKKRQLKRINDKWRESQLILPDRHHLSTALLIVPAVSLLLTLPFAFIAAPRFLSGPTVLQVSFIVFISTIVAMAIRIRIRLYHLHRFQLQKPTWSSRNGFRFRIEPHDPDLQAVLTVYGLVERRFSWRYRKTGLAEFEYEENGYSLAPYSFRPASKWLNPIGVLVPAIRNEERLRQKESEALCQILAGQSSSRKSRSPLMGLMRKRPDHRLEIHLQKKGLKVSYSLPVTFWTSEISR